MTEIKADRYKHFVNFNKKSLPSEKQLEELHAGDVSVMPTGQSLINLPCCKIKHCRQILPGAAET